MMKHLKWAALMLLVAVGFTACSEDDPTPTPTPTPVRGESGLYVLNQGNKYSNIASSIDFLSLAEGGSYVSGLFQSVNNQALGTTAQKPIIYGSKIYIPMFDNNLLWVADAATMRIVAQVQTSQPEAVCSANGHVYVSNSDGYVTRVDTTNFSSSKIEVGPNPYGLAAANGKLYVAVSDMNNSAAAYANSAVAVIDLATFSKVKDIKAEGLTNVWDVTTDALGNVYVTTPYTSNKVFKIAAANDAISEFCTGTFIATNSQQRTSRTQAKVDYLYVINAITDWNTGATTVTSAAYDVATGAEATNTLFETSNLPASPISMDVNPATGDIYVCSDEGAFGYANPGYINVYNANGSFVRRINTGVHPFGVVFK